MLQTLLLENHSVCSVAAKWLIHGTVVTQSLGISGVCIKA